MPDYTIGRLRGQFCLVYWRDGQRHRHTLGTADPRQAERVAPTVYAELTAPRGRTIADLWSAYVATLEGRPAAKTMGHTWKALADRFGPLHPDHLTDQHSLDHIAARRDAGRKEWTIITELGHLQMTLNWAVKKRLIPTAPAIVRPSTPEHVDKHLTRAEARQLIDAAAMPHLQLFIVLALGTAARVTALLDLTWDRCDFDRGLIYLRDPEITRRLKGRAIAPMNRTVRAALLEAKPGALTAHVIEWAGRDIKSVRRGVAAAASRAKLPRVTPHMLRHTAAVHMAEAGRSMEEIAQYLGHSSVATTRRIYARFSPDYLRQAASILEYDDLAGSAEPERKFLNRG